MKTGRDYLRLGNTDMENNSDQTQNKAFIFLPFLISCFFFFFFLFIQKIFNSG